jgi:hypothetical protein
LYRSKLGDGPNAVYLLRTQIGIVPHRTRSFTSRVREDATLLFQSCQGP